MTYLGFLLIFLVPPIVLLLLLLRGTLRRAQWTALALLTLIALLYTSPWDNYLVIRGVWTFDREKILNVFIWHVPLEEYVFYMLQVLMSGLFVVWLLRRAPSPGPSPAARERGGPSSVGSNVHPSPVPAGEGPGEGAAPHD